MGYANKDAEEAFARVTVTFEKYRKNRMYVPLSELKGKYRDAYEKLKHRLADELGEYMREYCLSGYMVTENDPAVTAVRNLVRESGIGRLVGAAVFIRMDLNEAVRLAESFRMEVGKIFAEA